MKLQNNVIFILFLLSIILFLFLRYKIKEDQYFVIKIWYSMIFNCESQCSWKSQNIF